MGGEPGLGMGGAKYLASLEVVAIGAEPGDWKPFPTRTPS